MPDSPQRRPRVPAALVLWVLQFLGGIASAPVYALMAVYFEKMLGRQPDYTANLSTIQLVIGGICAPMAGSFADRMGYKPALLWGMTSTVASCAILLTGRTEFLVPLLLYAGLVGSLQTTAGQAYLMEATVEGRLGRASAGFFLGMTLGNAVGSRIAGKAVVHWGYTLVGIATSALAAWLILLALLLLPPLHRRGRQNDAAGNPSLTLGEMLQLPRVRLLLAIRFLPTCYWGLVTLLVPLLLFRLTKSEEAVGNFQGVSLACASAFQIIAGRVSDRHGVRLPLLLTPIGITISAVGLALGARSVAALWAFAILGACSAWSLSITMPILIAEHSAAGEKGRMVGLTSLAWCAGMMAGRLIGGHLGKGSLGTDLPGLPFVVAAVFGLATVVVSIWMAKGPALPAPATKAEPEREPLPEVARQADPDLVA